jgi:hypothetical protein
MESGADCGCFEGFAGAGGIERDMPARDGGCRTNSEALAGVVLRVGSKTPKVIARPRHALLGLGAPRAFHGHHSERRPGFRAGL